MKISKTLSTMAALLIMSSPQVGGKPADKGQEKPEAITLACAYQDKTGQNLSDIARKDKSKHQGMYLPFDSKICLETYKTLCSTAEILSDAEQLAKKTVCEQWEKAAQKLQNTKHPDSKSCLAFLQSLGKGISTLAKMQDTQTSLLTVKDKEELRPERTCFATKKFNQALKHYKYSLCR